MGGTSRDLGEGRDIKQNKAWKELVEDPTRKQQENSLRSKEPESHRKDPKNECRQGQPEKVGNERKPQSPGHQGLLGKLQDDAGDCSGYRKGQGSGGTPWPLRISQNTGKGQGAEEQHGPRKRQDKEVGRVRLGEPAREVPESPMKGGRKVQTAAPVNMPALLDLSSELL